MSGTLDISQLRDMNQIRELIEKMHASEVEEDSKLREMLNRRTVIEMKMDHLQRLAPKLQKLSQEAKNMSEMVGSTSSLAENVSSKVRELDLMKSRLQDTLQRVDDIIDLKGCVEGVQSSIASENFEQAAAHIHRYLLFDKQLLNSPVVEMSEMDGSPYEMLEKAHKELISLAELKLYQAMTENNDQVVERFIKIYAILLKHETGLKLYAKYLSAKVGTKAEQLLNDAKQDVSMSSFVDFITETYESIALLIEATQPFVETHFGPGLMILLIEFMFPECDKQTMKAINYFKTETKIDERAKAVRNDLSFTTSSSSSSTTASKKDEIDLREIDFLLSESALIIRRTDLYFRFLNKRVQADIEMIVDTDSDETESHSPRHASRTNSQQQQQQQQQQHTFTTNTNKSNKKGVRVGVGVGVRVDSDAINRIFASSNLSRAVQDLGGTYVLMEEYFVRRNLKKAIEFDKRIESLNTSTASDDVFLIVQKASRRALSSGNADCVCAMLNIINSLLVDEVRTFIASQLQSGFGISSLSDISDMLQSKIKGKDKEQELNAKILYTMGLNNIRVCANYTLKMMNDLQNECHHIMANASQHDKIKMDSCLSDLSDASRQFADLLESGCNKLVQTVALPRIKQLCSTFEKSEYFFTEADLTAFDPCTPSTNIVISTLKQIIDDVKPLLSEENLDVFVGCCCDELSVALEHSIINMKFNRLGGLQFDKDLRQIITFLSINSQKIIRDKFIRLNQIAILLNLETVNELEEYWGSKATITWRLAPAEVRKILALRVDFAPESIVL